MACVGLYLLAFDLHFALPVCAALSLAYWCSALWVGWSLSLIVCGGLVAVAVAMRQSWLLFENVKVFVTYNDRRKAFLVGARDTVEELEKVVALYFKLQGEGDLLISFTDGDGDDVVLSRHLTLTADTEYYLRVEVGAFPRVASCATAGSRRKLLSFGLLPSHPPHRAPSVLLFFVLHSTSSFTFLDFHDLSNLL
jgi:hypothetical protein